MNHGIKVVLKIVIGLLALCAIGILVTYAILAPVRATGPAARRPEATKNAGLGLPPTLVVAPDAASPGQAVQATGDGFAPGARIALRLGVPNAGLSKVNLAMAVADAGGAFRVELALPTEWPGAQTPIVERELVIAAVDEAQSQTLAVAPFKNADAETVE